MRNDPDRLFFEIGARDGAARTGTLHTAHGPIRTPAFIPLATKGTVRGLESAEVAGLGYELILGNTYHLFVSPGPERIAAAVAAAVILATDKAAGVKVSRVAGDTVDKVVEEVKELVKQNTE